MARAQPWTGNAQAVGEAMALQSQPLRGRSLGKRARSAAPRAIVRQALWRSLTPAQKAQMVESSDEEEAVPARGKAKGAQGGAAQPPPPAQRTCPKGHGLTAVNSKPADYAKLEGNVRVPRPPSCGRGRTACVRSARAGGANEHASAVRPHARAHAQCHGARTTLRTTSGPPRRSSTVTCVAAMASTPAAPVRPGVETQTDAVGEGRQVARG